MSNQTPPQIDVGDHLQLRKTHPCGNDVFKVNKLGADIRLECTQCGRRVMLERRVLYRRLKKIVSKGEAQA